MIIRTLPYPSGINAHDIFQTQSELFAALLEDPLGSGRCFLASAEGRSRQYLLGEAGALEQWRSLLPTAFEQNCDGGIGLHHLFYVAYEAVNWLERLPEPRSSILGPCLYLHEPVWSICLDAEQQCMHLAADSESRIQFLVTMIEKVQAYQRTDFHLSDLKPQQVDADYCRNVERVKEYILAGDVFQVNIARFWHRQLDAAYLPALYASLRDKNPAPFAAFFRAGPLTVLSSSPERLFQITTDGWLNTRPIAGTRPRAEGDEDEAMRAELLLSEKEQAEHIMLVDLERNDLGRVCMLGTIEVNERMVIERYATVQHIVSNVRGRHRPDCDMVDIFSALFPGGTITGCPKVRCMQIIHEMEPQPRAAYTGSLGYMASDGSCDSNILIRSFWHYQGVLNWAAGAGIVADSEPTLEYEETEHKVAGLLSALVPKSCNGSHT